MKRILVAPLDWGLGHAARCIPVIRQLHAEGCSVVIAGSGDSLALLQQEFPQIKSRPLPGYAPRYHLHRSMVFQMALQLPKFIQVIHAEHRITEKIVEEESIDLIISDNRYGCWSKKIHSVFITHQSNILMPKRFGFFHHIVRTLNERLINRFETCWVPDFPAGDSLAGDLISFGKNHLKTDVQYIGWLSRFRKERKDDREFLYDVLAVFSGPEPQRTALENIVVPQLQASGLRYRVVRGLPSAIMPAKDDRIVNFLSSRELQECIESSAIVIARSGYSTVMDLNALQKKAVFIPTPGQTEQEYLAKRLTEKGIAYWMEQKKFNLETALDESRKYSGFEFSHSDNLLTAAIQKLNLV